MRHLLIGHGSGLLQRHAQHEEIENRIGAPQQTAEQNTDRESIQNRINHEHHNQHDNRTDGNPFGFLHNPLLRFFALHRITLPIFVHRLQLFAL